MFTLSIKQKLFVLLFCFLLPLDSFGQGDIYWGGGSGDWSNAAKWFKNEEATIPAGVIPNANSIVHFTDFSSGIPNWNVRIQPGSYDVHSILVETNDDFRIFFNGTNGNIVEVNVYGDIDLLPSHRLEYASDGITNNTWRFVGDEEHNIRSGGQELLNIELLNTGGTFAQLDDWTVSEQIRMYAGTWNSNGYDLTCGKVFFQDSEPSNAPLTKVFNSGSSEILCEEWESGFTYGSLLVTGNHTIKTRRFRGSPKQQNGTAFEFHEIHLLEYSDAPIGGVPIEHNNFECRSCIVESIVVEDTGDTKFADAFTLTGKLTITNLGSSILFNGGNGRNSEVTFEGTIITPKINDCNDPRTIFSSVHTDLTIFKRNSGTLTISGAVVNNIQTETSGGAVFNLSAGILQGASTGWNLINPPTSTSYFWRGPAGGIGNWNDPSNWILQGGASNGCIPTIADDVYIDDGSKGDIRIPNLFNAECRHFFWSNKSGLELVLDGTNTLESALTVAGHFDLNSSAIITPILRHEIYFSSTSNNYIETRGVQLPEIWFVGDLGQWALEDDLSCDRLTFEGGTLNTINKDIVTDYWNCLDDNPKYFNFGSSHITVNGEMALSRTPTANVTVNEGTSYIECEDLTCSISDLYDVQLNNSSVLLLENYPYNFNTLILNGAGEVSTQNDMTLNDLVFMANGSGLVLDSDDDLTINGGIESMALQLMPAVLKSNNPGIRADIKKPVGNICLEGFVELTDINGDLSGVFNAPDATDDENNSGINFDDGLNQLDLYWIGGSGEWQVKENWSRVSGGCPSTGGPSIFPNLIFNNFGLYDNHETISVPSNQSCGTMFFYNSAKSITLDIETTLSPTNIVVANGDLSVTGRNLFVGQETRVESGGLLSTNMLLHRTETLTSPNGLIIVRNGAKLEVSE